MIFLAVVFRNPRKMLQHTNNIRKESKLLIYRTFPDKMEISHYHKITINHSITFFYTSFDPQQTSVPIIAKFIIFQTFFSISVNVLLIVTYE